VSLPLDIWPHFVDEMVKISAKPRHTIQVPSPDGGGGQNFGKFTKAPGQTKMTGESRKLTASNSLLPAGRTGSATDTPLPPQVR